MANAVALFDMNSTSSFSLQLTASTSDSKVFGAQVWDALHPRLLDVQEMRAVDVAADRRRRLQGRAGNGCERAAVANWISSRKVGLLRS